MASAPTTRPSFDPVDTSFDPREQPGRGGDDSVESPSLSSSNALARFEFEDGRGSKDGTKVLMVEWEEDDTTRHIASDWEIRWDGKRTVLPARDHHVKPNASSSGGEDTSTSTAATNPTTTPVNRLYFLLGPGVAVPTAVRLQKGPSITWRTNPLPAIFSPDLGATARSAGKKGVLHTVWAKKRLQVLQREIDAESRTNAEGVGLEMAVAEKEWIEENFGVHARPSGLGLGLNISTTAPASALPGLNSPTSPRSPGGGRLMDKLRGLKIDTHGEQDATARSSSGGVVENPAHNPLSPETSDVAIGSFGSFAMLKGVASSLGAKPAQPPERVRTLQQQQHGAGMGSLNALAAAADGREQKDWRPGPVEDDGADDDSDDLFAMPMNPRSPETAKSPFTSAAKEPVGR